MKLVPIQVAGTTTLTTIYTCPNDGSVSYAMFRGLRASSSTASEDATVDLTRSDRYLARDLPVRREDPVALVSRDDNIDVLPGQTLRIRSSESGVDFVGTIEEVAPK